MQTFQRQKDAFMEVRRNTGPVVLHSYIPFALGPLCGNFHTRRCTASVFQSVSDQVLNELLQQYSVSVNRRQFGCDTSALSSSIVGWSVVMTASTMLAKPTFFASSAPVLRSRN